MGVCVGHRHAMIIHCGGWQEVIRGTYYNIKGLVARLQATLVLWVTGSQRGVCCRASGCAVSVQMHEAGRGGLDACLMKKISPSVLCVLFPLANL